MSCLFKLFGKKTPPPPKRTPSQTFAIPILGLLPEKLEELQILELEIGRRMTYLNGKASRLYSYAAYCQGKGDVKKAVHYIRQRKDVVEEITTLGKRLMEVQTKLTTLTPPKIEVVSPLQSLYIK